MDLLFSIILGLVEGITEFLPISSTAHILITTKLMGIEANQSFDIAIQSGAMLAVIGLYVTEIDEVIKDIPKIIIAFIPTALVGYFVYPLLSSLHSNFLIMGIVLIAGGVIMISIKKQIITNEDLEIRPLSNIQALSIGVAQSLAVIPGVSRSGGIFIYGELAQVPRKSLVRFSFLLGALTIFAATAYDLIMSGTTIQIFSSLFFILAFIVAGFSAWFTCKWLLNYMTHAPLSHFGWYRVLLGLILIIFLV